MHRFTFRLASGAKHISSIIQNDNVECCAINVDFELEMAMFAHNYWGFCMLWQLYVVCCFQIACVSLLLLLLLILSSSFVGHMNETENAIIEQIVRGKRNRARREGRESLCGTMETSVQHVYLYRIMD